MCSSSPSSSLSTLIPLSNIHLPSSSSHSNSLLFTRKLINPRSILSPLSISVVSAENSSSLELSWAPPDRTDDDCGGWAIVEEAAPTQDRKRGFPKFVLVGIGTSIATFLAAVAYFSFSRRGLLIRFRSPFHALHGILKPSSTEYSIEGESTDALPSDVEVPEVFMESVSDEVAETVGLEKKMQFEQQKEKFGRILIPAAVDIAQQEALSILKKLMIIEEDIKAEELCTRREYARWLVRANSLLERNPKHRLLPPAALSGSISAAFDDIHVQDPDFEAIQSLSEAGIVPSRLARKNFSPSLDNLKYEEGVSFFPERFLSRQDLIDWKAQLEYDIALRTNDKISGSNLGFMDVREINSDASHELFVDMLAGDKSIFKRVFGRGKRFQPNKPSTKAQAAVALTSGRTKKAIRAEILRLEAEDILRQKEMEEIRSTLLDKGDIKGIWEIKLEEERSRAIEVERAYLEAIHDLEQENISQEIAFAEYNRQRAAMDCQKQLLISLKEEVDEMSERLVLEKAKYMDEQRLVQDMFNKSQGKLEGSLDAKSILEAEIEALRILRSWIEDEAKKSQARVKVLEDVGRRWKWDDR